jgi:hypothetical protein
LDLIAIDPPPWPLTKKIAAGTTKKTIPAVSHTNGFGGVQTYVNSTKVLDKKLFPMEKEKRRVP